MTTRTRLLYVLAGLVAVVVLLHGIAFAFSLYWRVSWFDNFPHFFGGMFVSLLCIWLWFFSGYLGVHPLPSPLTLFLISILSSLVIGAGWEVFERLVGVVWSPEGYWLDTSTDVLFDILGGFTVGISGYLFLRKSINANTKS